MCRRIVEDSNGNVLDVMEIARIMCLEGGSRLINEENEREGWMMGIVNQEVWWISKEEVMGANEGDKE